MADEVDPLLERINQVLAECTEPAGRQHGKATRLDELVAEASAVENLVVLPEHHEPIKLTRGERPDLELVDEPIEPRADQTRGWLAGLLERLFG